MRSALFNIAFGAISIVYAVRAALASLRPGQAPVRRAIKTYVNRMIWAMRALAGIEIEVRGRENLPEGSFILAPKHSSYGDGFSIYAQFDELAIVTGDQLERIPLLKTVLQKLGAIVVDNCGGPEARDALTREAAHANADGRKILIYPEGHLAPVGVYFRYRSGVFHMAQDFDMPVVPVASSLGVFWQQEDKEKRPGHAVLEFLPPLSASLGKDEFMAALQNAVEDRTALLVAEARNLPVRKAVLGAPAGAKSAP